MRISDEMVKSVADWSGQRIVDASGKPVRCDMTVEETARMFLEGAAAKGYLRADEPQSPEAPDGMTPAAEEAIREALVAAGRLEFVVSGNRVWVDNVRGLPALRHNDLTVADLEAAGFTVRREADALEVFVKAEAAPVCRTCDGARYLSVVEPGDKRARCPACNPAPEVREGQTWEHTSTGRRVEVIGAGDDGVAVKYEDHGTLDSFYMDGFLRAHTLISEPSAPNPETVRENLAATAPFAPESILDAEIEATIVAEAAPVEVEVGQTWEHRPSPQHHGTKVEILSVAGDRVLYHAPSDYKAEGHECNMSLANFLATHTLISPAPEAPATEPAVAHRIPATEAQVRAALKPHNRGHNWHIAGNRIEQVVYNGMFDAEVQNAAAILAAAGIVLEQQGRVAWAWMKEPAEPVAPRQVWVNRATGERCWVMDVNDGMAYRAGGDRLGVKELASGWEYLGTWEEFDEGKGEVRPATATEPPAPSCGCFATTPVDAFNLTMKRIIDGAEFEYDDADSADDQDLAWQRLEAVDVLTGAFTNFTEVREYLLDVMIRLRPPSGGKPEAPATEPPAPSCGCFAKTAVDAFNLTMKRLVEHADLKYDDQDATEDDRDEAWRVLEAIETLTDAQLAADKAADLAEGEQV
jgi:hypothetical protein